jgi:hypothetical protein
MPPDNRPSTPAVASTPQMFCKKCGYALVGLDGQVCPECGRAFDPANRKTFSRKPPRGLAWRWGKRLAALLLPFLLAAGGGIGWLWWGWHAEQPTIARLSILHREYTVTPIGPPRLQGILGKRWGYLADRVDDVRLWHLTAADTEALDLGSLSQVKSLTLDDCQVSQPTLDNLAGLQKLQTLNLLYSKTEKLDLAFLENLPVLSHLVLWSGTLDRAGLEHIGRLKRLITLRLVGAGLTDDDLQPLQGLSSLEVLRLHANPITDAGLEHLQGLNSLKHLEVDERLVDSPGMAKLKQALPGLQVIGD